MMQQQKQLINPAKLWHDFPVTQEDLAEVFYVDVRTVRNWISGKTNPSRLVIDRAISLYQEWSKNGVNISLEEV